MSRGEKNEDKDSAARCIMNLLANTQNLDYSLQLLV